MAELCSRILGFYIVIFPLRLVTNSTWHLFTPLIALLPGLVGSYGLSGRAVCTADALMHCPFFFWSSLKAGNLWTVKQYSQVQNMLLPELKRTHQTLSFCLCGGRCKMKQCVSYFGWDVPACLTTVPIKTILLWQVPRRKPIGIQWFISD